MGILAGKVALVTGAGSGMGEAQAHLFAKEGARVVVADINPAGQRVADAIGDDAIFVRLDCGCAASWAAAIEATEQAFGRLDILLNTAGVSFVLPLEDTTDEQIELMYRCNFLGVILGMRSAIEPMRRAGGGAIVNISSGAALRGNQNMVVYGGTKWAVRGMTRSAAKDLARDNIRVNTIFPGFIDTPMVQAMDPAFVEAFTKTIPAGRVGTPDDIAQAALFLVSDRASYVTGAELAVNGALAS